MTKFLLLGDIHYRFNNNSSIIESFIETLPMEIDVVLNTGDTISHDQSQWDGILNAMRRHFPDIPILTVLGNHDYWSDRQMTFLQLQLNRRRLFRKYNINYLEDSPVIIDGIAIFGFDGWYWSADPPSNDDQYIYRKINDAPFNGYFLSKAEYQLSYILKKIPRYKKTVIVTHFDPNDEQMGASSLWLEKIKEKAQGELVFCCGHTHRQKDEIHGNLRILNAGGDYNIPAYSMFIM